MTVDTGNVESTLAELEWAGQLKRAGVPFQFVVPGDVQGQSYYEAEIQLSNGLTMPCEMKCKIEGTVLSSNTMKNTLKQAAKQLPEGKAALVFIKLPEEWISNPDLPRIVEEAVRQRFRDSSRVVAVLFRWEEWFITPEGWRMVHLKFRHYVNQDSPLLTEEGEALLERVCNPSGAGWVSFRQVVISRQQMVGASSIP